jgi:uncharacterized phage infection (PIP) family protein YhgE
MTLDDTFRQFFNDQFKSHFPDPQRINDLEEKVRSFTGNLGNIINKNNEYSQKIAGLESVNRDLLQKNKELEENLKKLTDNLGIIINSAISKNNEQLRQEIGKLQTSQALSDRQMNDINIGFRRQVTGLEGKIENYRAENRDANSKIQTLSRQVAELETKNKPSAGFEAKSSPSVSSMQFDTVIKQFNSWAANPAGPLPSVFTFLEGEPRIRTLQQLMETNEKAKWISNRSYGKKYLLPNPNFFDPMTNILMFYKMDQTMLKPKGMNKITIVTPCEMRSDGWIDFPGELKILP